MEILGEENFVINAWFKYGLVKIRFVFEYLVKCEKENLFEFGVRIFFCMWKKFDIEVVVGVAVIVFTLSVDVGVWARLVVEVVG